MIPGFRSALDCMFSADYKEMGDLGRILALQSIVQKRTPAHLFLLMDLSFTLFQNVMRDNDYISTPFILDPLARLRFAQPQPKIDERRRPLMYGMVDKNINRTKGATP